MAARDRARDFLARFVTDTDKFSTERAAQQLERLGSAGQDTGRDLDRLGDQAKDTDRALSDVAAEAKDADRALGQLAAEAKDAGSATDRLGDQAKDTAARVDDAFDRIAASSRASLRDKVRADSDAAGGSLRDVGDEAADTAREMGASFSGSADDVTDAFQEVAANALASFGVVGVAAGVAAAVGIGALRAQSERLREEVGELTGAMLESGGRLQQQSVLDKLRAMAEDGSIRELAEQADRAKVPVTDYLLALAGDPAALQRSRQAITDLADAAAQSAAAHGDAGGVAAATIAVYGPLERRLEDTAKAYGLAQDAVDAYTAAEQASADAAGVSADALEAVSSALEGFADPLGTYTGLLAERTAAEQESAQATADATADATDSWQDYAADVAVSVGDYLAELESQVSAQEEWAANMAVLSGRVSDATLAELGRLGPEGAPLVAELTRASDAELAQLDDLYARRGKEGTDALTAALAGAGPLMGEASRVLGADAAAQLAAGLLAGRTTVEDAARQVWEGARAQLQRQIRLVATVPNIDAASRSQAQRELRAYELEQGLTPGSRYRP